MFYEDAKIMSKKGNEARSRKLTPEQRSEIATKASYSRWYKASGEQIERIDSYLRGLSLIAAKALAEGNDKGYVQAVNAMGQYERMKLMIEGNRSKDAKPAEEIDEPGAEAVKMFKKGRNEDVEDVIDVTERKK